ncbi:MAG: aspartate carbamoyltransferase catalytic subunit [Xanthomonadales bacterium]|nr:aspartate carbamoyltransferase catalytic subunit [Xanthomonadales bacterium]
MSKPLTHFTDATDCDRQQLEQLIDLGVKVSENLAAFDGARRGGMLVNLFYEPSTRTRVSFETAAKRLGMHVINVSATGSSVEKGESLTDTFFTLQAMGPDCIVVRHPEEGNAARLAEIADAGVHVINAGDGVAAHPSQALLDALTLRQHFDDFSQIRLVMAGDIAHSRVARSSIAMLRTLGVGEIRLAGPPEFLPDDTSTDGTVVFSDFDSAISGANAIMMLRIQKERISGLEIPFVDEYHRGWGLDTRRLARAESGCLVMHPGPMNRGVEIATEVADGPQSLIRTQVRNGLFARMALLLTLTPERS